MISFASTRKHIRQFFLAPRFLVNLVVLVIFVLLVQGREIGKVKSTLSNVPTKSSPEVLVVDESAEVLGEVDEIVGKVVGQVADEAEVKEKQEDLKVEQVSESVQTSEAKESDSLCRGVKEDWKMIPDPNHAGQYIICNTEEEKMTTVDELNAAQNSYRQKHGLGALNINSGLCSIANSRAKEIANNFSHSGFESAVKGSGLGKSSYGENIASGPLSGVHFIEWSWDKSPGHRDNMLGDWTDGCGGVYGKYAVFLFAK